MSHHPLSVSIIYAPSPDDGPTSDPEDCAAYQYACRAKEFLLSPSTEGSNNTNNEESLSVTVSCIQESSFEDILDEKIPKRMLLLLILSCSADGSIHRLLRKATKRLGQQEDGTTSSNSSRIQANMPLAVALLGHARCDNSAKQMKQVIFGSGRRIEKALLKSDHGVFVSILQDRLETQVELVGPEVDFDPWLRSVMIGQC